MEMEIKCSQNTSAGSLECFRRSYKFKQMNKKNIRRCRRVLKPHGIPKPRGEHTTPVRASVFYTSSLSGAPNTEHFVLD